MAKTFVKAAHATAQFYQEVYDPETDSIVIEHVRAETVNGKQVPVPMEVTVTPSLQRALLEKEQGPEPEHARRPARIVECSDEEIAEERKRRGAEAAESGPKASKAARQHAAELEIDLNEVEGTGADGAITKNDVQAHADAKADADAGDDEE